MCNSELNLIRECQSKRHFQICKHEKKIPLTYFPGSLISNVFQERQIQIKNTRSKTQESQQKTRVKCSEFDEGCSKNPAAKTPIQTPVRKRRMENLKSQSFRVWGQVMHIKRVNVKRMQFYGRKRLRRFHVVYDMSL